MTHLHERTDAGEDQFDRLLRLEVSRTLPRIVYTEHHCSKWGGLLSIHITSQAPIH
jgi:hypothetical protein